MSTTSLRRVPIVILDPPMAIAVGRRLKDLLEHAGIELDIVLQPTAELKLPVDTPPDSIQVSLLEQRPGSVSDDDAKALTLIGMGIMGGCQGLADVLGGDADNEASPEIPLDLSFDPSFDPRPSDN